ncbi:hypothetical protein CKM354_000971900 [Cercospora kikuchii]|uniref:Uncharacterized protein n=1 Tax=Cercospora kikuchii TaxID=84275 RepID=A0A9P3CLD2_9PEZI|nr:uncharacterized protein CKM354_000971900 [Cercospora kikuchii]GIZ46599.1 hypothetical protein CKM354_000971900 [Cercospora kikuchii]
MNRGNIPGFYFDEEKKKYFQITADHVAPVDAKHSKTNVKREKQEKRALKKQRFEERVIRKQTVNQAKSLTSGLFKTTLQRELGHRTGGYLSGVRDEALVNGLEHKPLIPRIKGFNSYPVVRDALYATDQSNMLFATTQNSAATCVYSYDWQDNVNGPQDLAAKYPLAALSGRFVTLQRFDSTLLFVSNTDHAIHYYLGPSRSSERNESALFPKATLQNTVDTVHACAFEPATRNIAFAGTGLLVVDGLSPGWVGRSNFGDTKESFAATWLQPNVLAYGLDTEVARGPPMHTVCLWDVRVGSSPSHVNSSTRLKRYHRITGLQTPESIDHQLLVTTNKDINLYDLRMQSITGPPLLSIQHTSVGSQLDFAVRGDLIAAVDALFRVQVFSLRTSRHLKTLQRNQSMTSRPSPLHSLRWQENSRGSPYLQACADSIVHRWGWQV